MHPSTGLIAGNVAVNQASLATGLVRGVTNLLLSEILLQNKAIEASVAAKAPKDDVENELYVRDLVINGVVSGKALAKARAQKLGMHYWDITEHQPDPEAIAALTAELCRKHTVLPVKLAGGDLYVATANPGDILAMDDIRASCGYFVIPVLVDGSDLLAAINKAFRIDSDLSLIQSELAGDYGVVEQAEDEFDFDRAANDAPIVRFVNVVISQAIADRASDIHIEPGERDLRIRYRIDGVLHEMQRESKSIQAGVISRIKIMSDIDIAERRKPQDGRMTFRSGEESRDLRVATLPTVWGEKIIMRILDTGSIWKSVDNLGMREDNQAKFMEALQRTSGMILVTGPTGSGKTTTLYASLRVVQSPEVNIITVEDPVEFRVEDINQMQVNVRAGLTFASALRSILRADPDIVLVGEIRDKETAQIALEASLTGHLVLSTLHANDAPSSLMRFIELGVEPFIVASSLALVVAQRLARCLCEKCKIETTIPKEVLTDFGYVHQGGAPTWYKAVGCSVCSNTGYIGRLAIHEVMPVTEEIAQLAMRRVSSDDVAKVAVTQGMSSLLLDGLSKAAAGLTSVEEVMRVVD
jgi:type IV pilus assembly protein PilB